MLSDLLVGVLVAIVLDLLLMLFLLISLHRLNFKAYGMTIALMVMSKGSPLYPVVALTILLCVILARLT